MKRLFVTITALALLLSGCGSAAPVETEVQEAAEQDKQVEVSEAPVEEVSDVVEISEEVAAQLENMSVAAQSDNGKATIYYETIPENGYFEFGTEIYLLYNGQLNKLPYIWFTKYTDVDEITAEDIAIECMDFDDDGTDEIAISKRYEGGTGVLISDFVMIENPGSDNEHHYLYNVTLGSDEWFASDEGTIKLGDFELDGVSITGINPDADIYDYIEAEINTDGTYVTIKRKSDGEEIGQITADAGIPITELHWSSQVTPEISEEGFIMNNEPAVDNYMYTEESMTLVRKFKYLGDGEIKLEEISGE